MCGIRERQERCSIFTLCPGCGKEMTLREYRENHKMCRECSEKCKALVEANPELKHLLSMIGRKAQMGANLTCCDKDEGKDNTNHELFSEIFWLVDVAVIVRDEEPMTILPSK